MQRVDVAIGGDRLHRGRQRLPEHLAAEDGAPAEVLALAAEEIAVESLEA